MKKKYIYKRKSFNVSHGVALPKHWSTVYAFFKGQTKKNQKMYFTILEFEDGLQLVPSKWLAEEQVKCFFPPYLSQLRIDRAIECEENPGKGWMKHNVERIFGTAASYKQGIKKLQLALQFLEIDNEVESFEEPRRKREFFEEPRRKRTESFEEPKRKRVRKEKCTCESSDENESCRISRLSHQEQNIQVPYSQPVHSPAVLSSGITNQHIQNELDACSKTETNVGSSSDIEQLKQNQQTMCDVLQNVLTIAQRIESKVDSLLVQSKLHTPEQVVPNDEHFILISSLPVGIKDFDELNEKIAESSTFRQRLKKIMMTVQGRDSKALAANVLRRLILDEVGEKFSLTGKQSKNGLVKQSFEKTEIYKLVLEICLHTFSNSKENVVREAVSDWLMQSKFRKIRREKRMAAVEAVLQDSTTN